MLHQNYIKNPLLPHQTGIQLWTNQEHQFIAANQSSVDLFGFKNLEQLIGRKPEDMPCQASECAPQFEEQYESVLQNQKPMTILDIHHYSNGDRRTFITNKSPL